MRTWTTVDMASPAGAFMTNQARCRCVLVQRAARDAAILGCKRWRWALDWRSLPFRRGISFQDRDGCVGRSSGRQRRMNRPRRSGAASGLRSLAGQMRTHEHRLGQTGVLESARQNGMMERHRRMKISELPQYDPGIENRISDPVFAAMPCLACRSSPCPATAGRRWRRTARS